MTDETTERMLATAAKPVLESMTFWVNLVTVLTVGGSVALNLAGALELNARAVALITILLGMANGWLRIYKTAQPVKIGDNVPAVGKKA